MSVLNAKHFHDETAAYEFVEANVWPNGPVCPHCGGCERISKMEGKSTRLGVYKCYACRKPFTVKVGTIFESSHVKLHIWLQAIFLMSSSKKGMSSNQLHRVLGVTLKTAWFMSHRIREAMRDNALPVMGGEGKIVEADETYFGNKKIIWHAVGEYVRGDVHTNTIEGYFSIFKRGMKGVYQHCSEKHLHRYLSEFDFRYNSRNALGVNDQERTVKAVKGIVGKRLTYRTAKRTNAA